MGCPWEPITDLRTQTYDSHGGNVLYSDSKQSGNLFKVDLYLLYFCVIMSSSVFIFAGIV